MSERLVFPDDPESFVRPEPDAASWRIETVRSAPFGWRWEALRVDDDDLHAAAAGVSPTRRLAVRAARRAIARHR